MATAELAACLPVLVLVLAALLSLLTVGTARVRVADAAREAARAAARGDDAVALRLARSYAPDVAVTISRVGDEVRAVARLRVRLLADWLPSVTVEEEAVAAHEPGPVAAEVPAAPAAPAAPSVPP